MSEIKEEKNDFFMRIAQQNMGLASVIRPLTAPRFAAGPVKLDELSREIMSEFFPTAFQATETNTPQQAPTDKKEMRPDTSAEANLNETSNTKPLPSNLEVNEATASEPKRLDQSPSTIRENSPKVDHTHIEQSNSGSSPLTPVLENIQPAPTQVIQKKEAKESPIQSLHVSNLEVNEATASEPKHLDQSPSTIRENSPKVDHTHIEPSNSGSSPQTPVLENIQPAPTQVIQKKEAGESPIQSLHVSNLEVNETTASEPKHLDQSPSTIRENSPKVDHTQIERSNSGNSPQTLGLENNQLAPTQVIQKKEAKESPIRSLPASDKTVKGQDARIEKNSGQSNTKEVVQLPHKQFHENNDTFQKKDTKTESPSSPHRHSADLHMQYTSTPKASPDSENINQEKNVLSGEQIPIISQTKDTEAFNNTSSTKTAILKTETTHAPTISNSSNTPNNLTAKSPVQLYSNSNIETSNSTIPNQPNHKESISLDQEKNSSLIGNTHSSIPKDKHRAESTQSTTQPQVKSTQYRNQEVSENQIINEMKKVANHFQDKEYKVNSKAFQIDDTADTYIHPTSQNTEKPFHRILRAGPNTPQELNTEPHNSSPHHVPSPIDSPQPMVEPNQIQSKIYTRSQAEKTNHEDTSSTHFHFTPPELLQDQKEITTEKVKTNNQSESSPYQEESVHNQVISSPRPTLPPQANGKPLQKPYKSHLSDGNLSSTKPSIPKHDQIQSRLHHDAPNPAQQSYQSNKAETSILSTKYDQPAIVHSSHQYPQQTVFTHPKVDIIQSSQTHNQLHPSEEKKEQTPAQQLKNSKPITKNQPLIEPDNSSQQNNRYNLTENRSAKTRSSQDIPNEKHSENNPNVINQLTSTTNIQLESNKKQVISQTPLISDPEPAKEELSSGRSISDNNIKESPRTILRLQDPSNTPSQTIRVNIGRIRIKTQDNQIQGKKFKRPTPSLSLQDYLHIQKHPRRRS